MDFNKIYSENQSYVRSLCRRFLPHVLQDYAEDCSQMVWLTAHESLAYFRGDCKIRTWLYWITRSKVNNFLKSNAREKDGVAKLRLSMMSDVGIDYDSPDRLAAAREMIDAIDFTDDKVALVLEWNNTTQTYSDLAKKYGVPEGTIRSRLFRGREMIDKSISAQEIPIKSSKKQDSDDQFMQCHPYLTEPLVPSRGLY